MGQLGETGVLSGLGVGMLSGMSQLKQLAEFLSGEMSLGALGHARFSVSV